MSKGTIRIIGGHFRGRKLTIIDSEGLRPTADRVRETLFNWLQATVGNARCLDLFAGSGALGFEALSRGASHVTFIEKSQRVASQLHTLCRTLDVNNATIHCKTAEDYLTSTTTMFDIIFLDPPFNQQLLSKVLPLACAQLAPKGLLYIESEATINTSQHALEAYRHSQTKHAHFGLYYPAEVAR